jgi:hypothetical protein
VILTLMVCLNIIYSFFYLIMEGINAFIKIPLIQIRCITKITSA